MTASAFSPPVKRTEELRCTNLWLQAKVLKLVIRTPDRTIGTKTRRAMLEVFANIQSLEPKDDYG
jgi:hypothetical protein